MTPWPASEETFALLPRLKPLGEFANYRFADWRNEAVTVSHPRCAAAVYSRAGEAYLLLANLDPEPHEVTCVLHPEKLPHPLTNLTTATRLAFSADGQVAIDTPGLDVRQLTGEGVSLTLPGDDVTLIQVR